jgi:rfaE bifunctional protein kinase chain/domain
MNINKEEIIHLFEKFNTSKVLVIGDVMIDSYLIGKVDRISPEAPVPVVVLKKRDNMLGGAANVALNIKSLGAEAFLCSIIGTDKQGDELLNLMEKSGLKSDGIVRSSERITTTKFRIIGNRVQMLRVDEEMDTDINELEVKQLLDRISELISVQKPDVIILQDYNKGVLTLDVITKVAEIAKIKGIPVAVDPKKKNFSSYKNITLFKPNLKEISEGLKIDVEATSVESLQRAAEIIHTKQDIEQVMITLSEHGVFMSSRGSTGNNSKVIPAVLRSIADVSGAGDTVISVVALCMAQKNDPILTATLSNLAGGLVCEHPGVVAIDKDELFKEAVKEFESR